jgi:hypothetical protein
MDMKSLFQQIGGRFKRDRQELPDEVVEGFLRVLEEVRIEDMPCSEVFAKLDEYVEKEVDGQDAAKLMPLLREHFDLCPDCCEEYETLLACLEKSSRDKGKEV